MKAPRQPATDEPLQPAAGGINCLLAEETVSHSADITLRGGATRQAMNRLMLKVGQAVMSLAIEESGTMEIQLTPTRHDDDAAGVSIHRWRVDVWKARQRQFLRVPVRKVSADDLTMPAASQPPETLVANGMVPLTAGQKLGEFNCPHCGLEHRVPPFTAEKLPRQLTFKCQRCTIPFHAQLVDVKGGS